MFLFFFYFPRINFLAQEEKIWAFLIHIVILISKKITTKQPNQKMEEIYYFHVFPSQWWVQGVAQRLINEDEWVNEWPGMVTEPSAVP